MRAENDSHHQHSPSSHDVAIVEKEQTIQSTGSETSTSSSPILSRSGMILPTKSILDEDDDFEVEELPGSNEKDNGMDVDIREDPENYVPATIEENDTNDLESVPAERLLNCALCQDDLSFQGHLVERLEFVTQCRHPRDFLSIFEAHDHHSGECNGMVDNSLFYHIPSTCEYCGSVSVHHCPSNCQRPRVFLAKKRPPFCRKGPTWDSKTDDAVIIDDCKQGEIEVKMVRSPFQSLFFGR